MMTGNEPIKTRENDREETILEEARTRARTAIDGWKHNFDQAEEDVFFIAGEQWPDSVRKEREDTGRPCLTLNKMPSYIDQVVGDQRQNRPAIHVHAVEADRSQSPDNKIKNVTGNADYTLSEIYETVIRNIEYTSNAEAHYDRAFQHCVESGFGWLRVLTQYSRDDSFEQDLCIKSIPNRFSVLMDPMASEPDLSDANYGFISEKMTHTEFRKRYPDKSVGNISDVEGRGLNWWCTEDMIRVAEYFRREPKNRELLLLSDGKTVWLDEVEDVLDELALDGITVVRRRKVKTHQVIWSKVTAFDVLEKDTTWPGTTIPVVPVLGKDMIIGDKTFYRGLIKHGKDAQRMHNFWMTAATERVALAPKAPYTGPAESFEGFEQIWRDANTSNRAYLPYNELPSGNRPTREQPATMPVAEYQLAMGMSDEMKATIGLYDASLGNQSNETSGRAIIARQRQGDRGTFTFVDNLSRAIRRIGIVLIEVIPKVYDTERVVRLRFEDESGDWVKINETIRDRQTDKDVMVHDITAGKFDVTVKAGPSYQTQRMEAADSMMQFVQAVPSAGGVVMDLLAKNMDWPGSKEIAERLKKMLPPGILSPDEMEEAGIEAPQPTPEQQAEMAKAEADTMKAQADMKKAEADTKAAEADMAMAQVKTMEAQRALAEIEMMAEMSGPDSMYAMVKQLVSQAIAEMAGNQDNLQTPE